MIFQLLLSTCEKFACNSRIVYLIIYWQMLGAGAERCGEHSGAPRSRLLRRWAASCALGQLMEVVVTASSSSVLDSGSRPCLL